MPKTLRNYQISDKSQQTTDNRLCARCLSLSKAIPLRSLRLCERFLGVEDLRNISNRGART